MVLLQFVIIVFIRLALYAIILKNENAAKRRSVNVTVRSVTMFFTLHIRITSGAAHYIFLSYLKYDIEGKLLLTFHFRNTISHLHCSKTVFYARCTYMKSRTFSAGRTAQKIYIWASVLWRHWSLTNYAISQRTNTESNTM